MLEEKSRSFKKSHLELIYLTDERYGFKMEESGRRPLTQQKDNLLWLMSLDLQLEVKELRYEGNPWYPDR